MNDLTLTGTATIEVNRTGRAVNETIATGGENVAIAYSAESGNVTRAVGSLEMDIAGFAKLSGDFGFERNANVLRVGARNVNAFVGANRTGVQLSDGNLGLLSMKTE